MCHGWWFTLFNSRMYNIFSDLSHLFMANYSCFAIKKYFKICANVYSYKCVMCKCLCSDLEILHFSVWEATHSTILWISNAIAYLTIDKNSYLLTDDYFVCCICITIQPPMSYLSVLCSSHWCTPELLTSQKQCIIQIKFYSHAL